MSASDPVEREPVPGVPPTVAVTLAEPLRRYARDRLEQHVQDSYAGLPLSKFPEDLRVYEHLLWALPPEVVIEIGTQFGASALWFRYRLRTLAGYGRVGAPRVVSIDLDTSEAHRRLAAADPSYARSITLVEADVRDPHLPETVERILGGRPRALVVEDSAHEYDTTRAALDAFARFVPLGGFFVVEDGVVDVDELRVAEDWPRGVLPAVRDWLRTEPGSDFVTRRELEAYGVSCHPEGFLQRHSSAPPP